ncbi:MAG: twin-arginine translocase TatA/TatE family subunit [Candidatus Poribacteria bacterium]|nr:twin-arginine translocase TatA/TatE family subunit [Candidatus Poribacteria bacterium]MDE0505045.1 twin-arginine translocase TatA/TatE family subunit [Candidatus Poribacteria bacterium]
MGLGLPEILIVLLIVILLFGAKRIPGLARGIGKSVTSFKAGMREEPEDEKVEEESETEKKPSQ